MATTEPQKWSATLGANADVNSLPATTPAGSGRASTSGLFPQITQRPLDEGGLAPERADFNALFKYLGDYIYYIMQGGIFSYLSTYAYTAGNLATFSGALYACVAANGPGNVHAPTDTAYWRKLALMSDMPAVGNGTITVQASGTPVGSFTVNQGSNSTISIPEATVNAFGVVKTDEHSFNAGVLQGWVRFRSGIQIVWGAGSADTPITFLRAFSDVPAVSATCTATSPGIAFAFARSSTGTTIRVWDPVNNTWATDGTFTYTAITTWS